MVCRTKVLSGSCTEWRAVRPLIELRTAMTFSRLELRSLGVGSISKKAESVVIVAPGLPAFAFTQSCARVGSEPVYGIVAQKARNGADPFVMSVADTVPTRVTDAVSSRTWLESRAAYVTLRTSRPPTVPRHSTSLSCTPPADAVFGATNSGRGSSHSPRYRRSSCRRCRSEAAWECQQRWASRTGLVRPLMRALARVWPSREALPRPSSSIPASHQSPRRCGCRRRRRRRRCDARLRRDENVDGDKRCDDDEGAIPCGPLRPPGLQFPTSARRHGPERAVPAYAADRKRSLQDVDASAPSYRGCSITHVSTTAR